MKTKYLAASAFSLLCSIPATASALPPPATPVMALDASMAVPTPLARLAAAPEALHAETASSAPREDARVDNAAHGDSDHEDSEEEGSNILGIKIEGLESYHPLQGEEPAAEVAVPEGEMAEESELGTALSVGFAPYYERVLIHEWLHVEVSVPVLFNEKGVTLPVDVLLSKPFELGEDVELFLSAGPAVTILDQGHESGAIGIVAAAGAFFWIGKSFGLEVESDYSVVFEEELVHEATLAAGPAVRF